MGTLKSTRIKTLLPFRSRSLTVSLVIIRREGIQGNQRIQGILGISSESFIRLLPHQFSAVHPLLFLGFLGFLSFPAPSSLIHSLGHEQNQVSQTVGVSPLVVIPGKDLDETPLRFGLEPVHRRRQRAAQVV